MRYRVVDEKTENLTNKAAKWFKDNRGRIIMNLVVVILLVLGHILYKYAGESVAPFAENIVTENGQEHTYYRINIHFHGVFLLGIAGAMCIQLALFLMVGADKIWRALSWAFGTVLLYMCNITDYIFSSSRILYTEKLKAAGISTESAYIQLWRGFRLCDYLVGFAVTFVGVLFVLRWISFPEGEDPQCEKTYKRNRLTAIIMAVVMSVILVGKSYSNPWYIILCAVYIILSWPVLYGIQKLQESTFLRAGLVSSSEWEGMLDKIWDNVFERAFYPDDAELYFEDDDSVGLTDFTLDLLLDYSEMLEEKYDNDTQRKEELVNMIRCLKNNCMFLDENT